MTLIPYFRCSNFYTSNSELILALGYSHYNPVNMKLWYSSFKMGLAVRIDLDQISKMLIINYTTLGYLPNFLRSWHSSLLPLLKMEKIMPTL
jgi:hypothetical protein